MKKVVLILSLLVVSAVSMFSITGKEVLDKVKDVHDNFKNEKSLVSMNLVDANGNSRERIFDMYLMKKGEDTLAMVRFNKPSEVKRITLLTLSDDEIYLYMPAYRKTKRISGGAKNGNFVGSDLKFSDISLLYNEQSGSYKANLLKETDAMYEVEILPEDKDSDYGRIVAEIQKENMLITKVEFYNLKKEHIKTMKFSNIKNFDGHVLATHIELKDLKVNHSTVLDIKTVEFDLPFTVKFFNKMNISKPVLKYR